MGTRVAVIAASVALVVLIIGAVLVLGRGSAGPEASPSPSTEAKAPTPAPGLQISDEVVGTGAEAKADSTVTAKYVGTLSDGTVFDASDRHDPNGLDFSLAGGVIEGWREGIPGMKVGGKRKLVVPPELGYGAEPKEGIPANSTLTFEVELVAVH